MPLQSNPGEDHAGAELELPAPQRPVTCDMTEEEVVSSYNSFFALSVAFAPVALAASAAFSPSTRPLDAPIFN